MDKDQKIDLILKQVSKEPLHFATAYSRAIERVTPENEKDVWHMLNVMREKDLVLFFMLGSKEVVLSSLGEDINDAGGWIEYNKRIKESADKLPTIIVEYKKHWYDTPLKIVAVVESIVIIISAIITLNMQSNSKQLQQENKQLLDTLAIRTQKLNDLDRLLKMKDKQILRTQESLDSLDNSLNVGQTKK